MLNKVQWFVDQFGEDIDKNPELQEAQGEYDT